MSEEAGTRSPYSRVCRCLEQTFFPAEQRKTVSRNDMSVLF